MPPQVADILDIDIALKISDLFFRSSEVSKAEAALEFVIPNPINKRLYKDAIS
jgi:hypothetical protein